MKVVFLAEGLQFMLCFVSIAGAIGADSCDGRCGQRLNNTYPCQCNRVCAQYSDCCFDILQKCTRIRLEGDNPSEGVVKVVLIGEDMKERNVGYLCQNGNWITSEASAACADLGYYGNATHFSSIDSPEISNIPILKSYAQCYLGETSLQECTFTTNITTQEFCDSEQQDGCCKGLVALRCTAYEKTSTASITTATTTITTTTTIEGTNENNGLKLNKEGKVYIYIVVGAVCVILIMIVALVVLLRSRRKGRKLLRNRPTVNNSAVAMGNVTSDQSADSAPTPFLASEVPCAEENTYASDPTSTNPIETNEKGDHEYSYVESADSAPTPFLASEVPCAEENTYASDPTSTNPIETNEKGDHEYSYVDVFPGRVQSEDLIHTYMYTEFSPE